MSITVILPLQVSKRVEWLALTFIIFIGLTSIAAAVTRYAVLVWIWTGPADRLTAGNFGLIELCVRLEIVFGAAAYGLCFARSLLRRAVRCLVGLGVGSGGRRKIVEEDVGRLKGVSLESGELEGPIGLEDLRRVGRLKAMSLESGERVGLEDLEGAERGYV